MVPTYLPLHPRCKDEYTFFSNDPLGKKKSSNLYGKENLDLNFDIFLRNSELDSLVATLQTSMVSPFETIENMKMTERTYPLALYDPHIENRIKKYFLK